MHFLKNLFYLILFGILYQTQGQTSLEQTKNICEKLRNLFFQAVVEYEQCVMHKAVNPVTYCHDCLIQYVDNVQSFQSLTSTIDPKSVREHCGDHYMNKDTLNTILRLYQNSRDLWNSASCTSCFVHTCDPDKITNQENATEICQTNTKILDLQNSSEKLELCLTNSDKKQGDVCMDCLSAYNAVAGQYQQLQSPNGICFEAVDQFNRTNNMWYLDRKCPKAEEKTVSTVLIVIIVLIGLSFTSGISFGGFYGYKKYRQRGNYMEQINTENGNTTPPMYS